MKFGTIIKGAFVAGVISGAVGIAVVSGVVKGTVKLVRGYRDKKGEQDG